MEIQRTLPDPEDIVAFAADHSRTGSCSSQSGARSTRLACRPSIDPGWLYWSPCGADSSHTEGARRLSDAKSCLTADTSVLIFVTVMVVLAPLRAVIFATTGLTTTAAQLLQNLPHAPPVRTARRSTSFSPSRLHKFTAPWSYGQLHEIVR